MLLMIPATLGLIVLGDPIMRLLYAHGGAFKESDVQMTSLALAGYAVGMTAYGFSKLLTPAFTSLSDPKIPMKIGFASIVVNVIVSYTAMRVMSGIWVSPERPDGLAHVGVALGASLVLVFKAIALILFMRKRIDGIEGRALVKAFVKITASALVMSVASYAAYRYLNGQLGAANLFYRFVECLVPVGLGGAVFLVCAKFLGVKEVDQATAMVRRRFGR
jgi:putative peptidoglycan lipid II flippase